MKIIPILLALTLCFLFQNNVMAAGTTTKVGIVDLERCIKESNEGKKAAESLKKELEAMQQRYTKAQKEITDLQKEIEKQSLMLSLDAKESKQNELDKKNREFGYLAQDLDEEAQNAKTNANQKILNQLYTVIQSMAKQQAFDMVLEKASAGIIFSSDALDITDQVIKEINKAKP
jgi:outer membrane protein